MDLNLAGQRAIVLGAARGIGRAIAEAFLGEGCSVVGVDRDWTGDRSSISCASSISCVNGDVTDLDSMQQLAVDNPDADHIVYCVAVGSGTAGFPFWKLKPDQWLAVLNVNLVGAVNVATAFAPAMSDRKLGTMLFLASVAGQIGSQTDPAYSASKAGLINFMQCAAKDLADHGVRVNAISPGMVQTELNRSVWQATQDNLPASMQQTYQQWSDEKIRRVSPLARWQTPQQCAAMAVYLASDHAATITGQTINIDAGQVMHS